MLISKLTLMIMLDQNKTDLDDYVWSKKLTLMIMFDLKTDLDDLVWPGPDPLALLRQVGATQPQQEHVI